MNEEKIVTPEVTPEELENLIVDRKGGTVDVIGLDVLRIHEKIETVDEAKKYLDDHLIESFDILTVGESTFVIRSMIADLNKVNGMIPEDLEASEAIPIQVKIGEILQAAGLNIGIDEEAQAVINADMDKAKEEITKSSD